MLDGASVVACLCQRKFKTAATVMFMLRISGLLEEYTQARTKAVLTDSLAIKTDRVWLVTDDGDVLIPIKDLRVGDKSVFKQARLFLLTVLLQTVRQPNES